MLPELIREWHTTNTAYDDKAYHTCWMCEKGGEIHVRDLRIGRYHQNGTALEECTRCLQIRAAFRDNDYKDCCRVYPCTRLFETPLPI